MECHAKGKRMSFVVTVPQLINGHCFFKQPFCLEMKSILRSVVKNKDYFKVDQILQFFIRISASRDGQIMLVKLNGKEEIKKPFLDKI